MKFPKNSADAIAQAILAFLPLADDAELRDNMERYFFEPAPHNLLKKLSLPPALCEALDLGQFLDDVWGLGEDARNRSVERIRTLLESPMGEASQGATEEEREVFRAILRRGNPSNRPPGQILRPLFDWFDPSMSSFLRQRFAAILKRPDGWGPPHAVELQVLLLVEMWHVAHGAAPVHVNGVTQRYDEYLGRTLPGAPTPLAHRLGLDQTANERFVEILRAFIEQECKWALS